MYQDSQHAVWSGACDSSDTFTSIVRGRHEVENGRPQAIHLCTVHVWGLILSKSAVGKLCLWSARQLLQWLLHPTYNATILIVCFAQVPSASKVPDDMEGKGSH